MDSKLIFKQRKVRTIGELTQRIREIMVEHVGVQNEITKGELFKELFGSKSFNDIQEWFLWHKVKMSMNFLRKTSNCFIASRCPVPNVWSFFVIKDSADLDFYKNNLKRNISRMYKMIERGEKLVEKKAYKDYLDEMKNAKG